MTQTSLTIESQRVTGHPESVFLSIGPPQTIKTSHTHKNHVKGLEKQMRREYALYILIFLLSIAFTSTSVFALYPTTDPWPMYRYDPARTGTTPSAAPNTNNTLWIHDAGTSYLLLPIIVEGKVIFNRNTQVYALDETTGVKIWETEAFTGRLNAELAFDDGKIYTGSDGGYLYCIDADNGAKLWEYQATASGYIRTSPVVDDGKVYFGTTDNYLYALNAMNGLYLWRYTAGGPIYSSPVIDGDLLYFGCDNGYLYALNVSGSLPALKWFFPTPGQQRVRCTPTVAGDKVFFGSYSTDHSIFAIDKTAGSLVWKYTFSNNWYTAEHSLAVADGIVYCIPNNGDKIYALYANAPPGDYIETDPAIRKWSVSIGSAGYNEEPVVADGKVFFSNYDAGYKVTALDVSDGSTIWEATAAYAFGRPVVADGRLFVVMNKYVYCFGSPYPPLTYHYPVSAGGEDFVVKLVINATPGDLDTSTLITLKKISYTLEGIDGTTGMSNITIPNEMLGGPYIVTVDGGLPLYSAPPVDNGTHTSLYFTYFQSVHTVEITGTTVIPEFPSAIAPLLLVTIALVMAALAKKRLLKN